MDARWLAVSLLALAVPAMAQDRAPTHDDTYERNVPDRPSMMDPLGGGPATFDPSDEAPSPDAPPTPPAPKAPAPADQPPSTGPATEPSPLDEIEVKSNGKLRLELGYDSNVFRSDHGRVGDGFFHGYGEAEVRIDFPDQSEIYASVSGEGFQYFRQPIADETYAGAFVELYHPINSVFDIDVQNDFEYSAQNLLDDNGDLLPRAKFDSYDEGGRVTLIAHASQQLSFELSGGARIDEFEDDPGLPSLSYWEARGSAGLRYKPWKNGRFRLRYVFRDRRYFSLPANLRDGTLDPDDPKLELQRHQVIAGLSQRLDLGPTLFIAQLSYTFTYNKDTFQNDRTYIESSLSAHVEWWPVPEWTQFVLDVRAGDRLFAVRRTLQRGETEFGTRLEQSYLEMTLSASQKIVHHISIVGDLSWYLYHSTDVNSNYARFVVQGGIEASW